MNYRKQLDMAKKALLKEDPYGTLEILECDLEMFGRVNLHKMSKDQQKFFKQINMVTNGVRTIGFMAKWSPGEGKDVFSQTTIMLRDSWEGQPIPTQDILSNFYHEEGHLRCLWDGCECYAAATKKYRVMRELHACSNALKMMVKLGGWKGILSAAETIQCYADHIFKGDPTFKKLMQSALFKKGVSLLPLDKQIMFL